MHGYQAHHVNTWYQTILHDLRQMSSGHTQHRAGGDLHSAASVSNDQVDFLNSNSAARRATVATIDSCFSSIAKTHTVATTESIPLEGDVVQTGPAYPGSVPDSISQAYHTPQSYQTYTTTPQNLESTPEPQQNQQVMSGWSPAPSSIAESDLYALSAAAPVPNGNLMAFAGEPTVSAYPWSGAPDISSLHCRTRSQQSHISQHSLAPSDQSLPQIPEQQQQIPAPLEQPYLPPEYNTQLPGTAMPVLVPYASSGGSGNYTKAAAIPTGPGASFYSSSAGYFPIIHVSSSRQRRKALQKGVKKMVQPLKGRRQQSV